MVSKNIFYDIDHLNEDYEQCNETEDLLDDEGILLGNNRPT